MLERIHGGVIQDSKQPREFFIRMLYLAAVQYQHKASRTLIEQSLKETSGVNLQDHTKCIWMALNKYPAPVYTGLIDQIQLSAPDKVSLESQLDRMDL